MFNFALLRQIMKVLSVLAFVFFSVSLTAQVKGTVEVIQDEKTARLVERHIQINDSLGTIPGFRLQLFFTSGVNGKKLAQEVEADFIKKYPDVPAYLIWDSPNYKVRVGDFRTRLDALKFQDEIKTYFPNAYIVPDEIKLPKL
jgi:hypothetical protein